MEDRQTWVHVFRVTNTHLAGLHIFEVHANLTRGAVSKAQVRGGDLERILSLRMIDRRRVLPHLAQRGHYMAMGMRPR